MVAGSRVELRREFDEPERERGPPMTPDRSAATPDDAMSEAEGARGRAIPASRKAR